MRSVSRRASRRGRGGDLIQPDRVGISRKRFWIPAHVAFELALLASLVLAWSTEDVRFCLLLGFANHTTMRIWSAFDFIPKALAFEKAGAGEVAESAARRWTRRSLLRLPLDLVTCGALLAALVRYVRVG